MEISTMLFWLGVAIALFGGKWLMGKSKNAAAAESEDDN